MPEPESNGSESDCGEEISGEFVIARGDAAEVFEFVEEALDEVALSVDRWIDRALVLSVALGRDMGGGAAGLDDCDDGAGVVTAIGDDVACQAHPVEQHRGGRLVGGLARREHEPDGQATSVDHGMDFGAQSSTRTTDGVIRAPFFPPAACWWARTIEESMR